MKKFLLGTLGVFFLAGAVYASDCVGNFCQQQVFQKVVSPVVQYQAEYVPQQRVVQRVVEYVEIPKIRIVEKVRVQPQVQYQVVKQQQIQKVKVVKQNVKLRQPLVNRVVNRVQNLRQNNVQKVQKVQQIRVVNQY